MKKGKAILLGMAMLCAAAGSHAQNMKNTIKIGALGGVAVPSNNANAALGVNVAYQNLLTSHFGLGVATGYQHYFGKNNDVNGAQLDNNSFGVIPIAALVRYYPRFKGIYIGTDVGFGIITGDEKVAANSNVQRPDGGFYLKPEVGYHNRNWNLFVHYTKTFTGDDGRIYVGNSSQKYSAGMIGVGFAYNIGLGR